MKLIKPSVEIESKVNGDQILKFIEKIGRVCYKSEDKITSDSAKKFVQTIVKSGHHSVIEHASISVRFVCDRGVMAELTRHRLCSFSVESSRYVNYNKKGVEFVLPPWITDIPLGEYEFQEESKINGANILKKYPKEYEEKLTTLPELNKNNVIWLYSLLETERNYNMLISAGWKPEQARSVLPNALKTEIVATANLREWMSILKLRTSKYAHPQMREIMLILLDKLKKEIPIIFDGIIIK